MTNCLPDNNKTKYVKAQKTVLAQETRTQNKSYQNPKRVIPEPQKNEAIAYAEYSIAMTSLTTNLFVKTIYIQYHHLTLMLARGLCHPVL